MLNNLKDKLNLDNSFDELNVEEKKKKFELIDFKVLISNIKDNNKIIFINPLNIKNETFSVDEMYCVFDTLFTFKNPGNIIAHINISPDESIKLKKVDKEIPDIQFLIGNTDGYNNHSSLTRNNNSININNGTNNININEKDINNRISSNNKRTGINKNDTNTDLIDKNIRKKIIDNINSNKIDWLEIETNIIKDVENIVSNIKKRIIDDDFSETSINLKLNINDIINFIFNKDYSNIYGKNNAFSRGLSLYIDDLVKKEKLTINYAEFNEIKVNIIKTAQTIKSMENNLNVIKKLKFKLPDKIYSQIKTHIKRCVQDLLIENHETNMISLPNSYTQIIDQIIDDFIQKDIPLNNFDKLEKKILIISIIPPEILLKKNNNLNFFINKIRNSIKQYFIFENVLKITKNIYDSLEKNINTDIDVDNSQSASKNNSKKFKSSNSSKVNVNEQRLKYIIKKMFENENINWTVQKDSEISLESLLFYYQNKNI